MDTVIEFAMDNYAASVGFALRRGIPRHLAEDMISDAIVNVLKSKPGREIHHPRTYWWRTLENVCRSYFRRRREVPIGEHGETLLDRLMYWRSVQRPVDEDPEAAVIGVEGVETVQAILAGLSLREREAMARRIEGLQQPDVAGRVNLFRVRKKLRGAMEAVGA